MRTSKIDIYIKAKRLLPAMIAVAMIIAGCATQPQSTSVPSQEQTQPPQEKPQPRQDPGKSIEAQPRQSQLKQTEGQESETSAEAQLEAAREKLQVSRDTEKRVQAEFEKLQQSGQASADVTRDYETYLARIKSLASENRAIVEKIEAAAGLSARGREKQTPPSTRPKDTAELDQQLNQALAEFDQMLLKEMERIQAQSAPKMTSLAEEAAAAADRLRSKGIDLGAGDEAGETAPEKNGATPGDKSEPEPEASTAQTETSESDDGKGSGAESEAGDNADRQAKTGSGGDTTGRTSSNGSAGYGDDDDIVARQLREAAENETDPELKEKLWKEYEDYKRNTRR